MDKKHKITKAIVTTIAIICGILMVAVISSGLSIMIYRSNTPRIIMKQNVTITEGETIMLSEVVEKAEYKLGVRIFIRFDIDSSEFYDPEEKKILFKIKRRRI